MTVAVLFARTNSVYKTLPDVEVYDIERDARTYDGPWPVVAHPPCRAWGRLRTFASPRPDERNLARLAVAPGSCAAPATGASAAGSPTTRWAGARATASFCRRCPWASAGCGWNGRDPGLSHGAVTASTMFGCASSGSS